MVLFRLPFQCTLSSFPSVLLAHVAAFCPFLMLFQLPFRRPWSSFPFVLRTYITFIALVSCSGSFLDLFSPLPLLGRDFMSLFRLGVLSQLSPSTSRRKYKVPQRYASGAVGPDPFPFPIIENLLLPRDPFSRYPDHKSTDRLTKQRHGR